tara:strand:+ start:4557 stop:4925 length:369 start_codon:yes stop_codon:yes gene_type:complete
MSYQPYTIDNILDLNKLKVVEGYTQQELDNITTGLQDFEDGKNKATANWGELTDLLDEHTKLITSETYGKNNYGKIPSNGKQKTTVADSMNTDLKQLNNTNSETYILGSIALASLVILTLYL